MGGHYRCIILSVRLSPGGWTLQVYNPSGGAVWVDTTGVYYRCIQVSVFITRWGCVGGHYRCIILCVYHQVGLSGWTVQVYNPMCLLPGGSEWMDSEPL